MIHVSNREGYGQYFQGYNHNRAMIYGSLRGQYPCDLYVDCLDEPQYGILFTAFDYHYVFGKPEDPACIEGLKNQIFKVYLKDKQKKEAIVLGPDPSWHGPLKDMFMDYCDIVDMRYVYRLNKSIFSRVQTKESLIYTKDQDMGSKEVYPQCQLVVDGHVAAKCSAFMTGGGHAELDVSTDQAYRRMGYGKAVSQGLIKLILEDGLEADWQCWSNKEASQALAESLGFEKILEVPAYIWVEEVCGPL